MKIKLLIFTLFATIFSCRVAAQDVALYNQFNGRFDFTFIGNTLNPEENGNPFAPCVINTTSAATLSLAPENIVEKAYLYWAGSGAGDFEVKLNGTDIVPERTFSVTQVTGGGSLVFFSAFRDITGMILATGNGEYVFSDMDLSAVIPEYCGNRTNFGGWAIIIVYKNESLPLNQLNLYDGLQFVSQVQNELSISLSSLNVIDNEDARIGFLAWEGDKLLDTDESLLINGNELSNALNPADNAFNGTNTFTNSNTLYNMDLDVYDIQNNINIGDTTAEIQMTSGQDFVMINAIVTKLNSQLPDATIAIGEVALECGSRTITVDYTVSNINSTNELQAGVPISIYADGIFIGYDETTLPLAIGESVSMQTTLVLPDGVPDNFTLLFVVDDDGSGAGIVTELNENNNTSTQPVSLLINPIFNALPPLEACNEGFGAATFDFSPYIDLVTDEENITISFYTSAEDAANGTNPIINIDSYFTSSTPVGIFIRLEDETCFSVTSFLLQTKNCPPIIYNYVSANNDGVNDGFFIDGLRDVFLNFEIEIYNRWGVHLWSGNNSMEDWSGIATKGLRINGNQVPDGTYYYILKLNDPGYPEAFTGFLYLNR